jgi:predicted alpha-1,2-mannosidase
MGGENEFVSMLDTVFEMPPLFDDSYYGFPIHEIREMQIAGMGNYAHGNQPIQHMIYLYNYAGQPWKAQQRVREVLTKLYTSQADGYCGDEDNGQTSAWYVFSAMGFYPVCPGTDQYVFGAPLFNKITLQLENGNEFVIHAAKNSKENVYVNEIVLNGKNWDKNFITHETLIQGGEINFTMTNSPNKKRGISKDNYPYSMTNEK